MKELTSKQQIRLEKKKKKMAAYLEILKLNDCDRKNNLMQQNIDSDSSSTSEPVAKRKKKENDLPSLAEVDKDCNSHETENLQQEESKSDQESINTIGRSGKPLLNGDEYLELKMKLRERKKELKNLPRFRLKSVGDKATLSVQSEKRIPIFLNDIQHLLLYAQLGSQSIRSSIRWCQLEKYNRIPHTILLVFENISLYHYMSYESIFSFLNTNFENKLEIITPSSTERDLVHELASVPLTRTQKHRLVKKYGSLEAALQLTGAVNNMLKTVFPMKKSESVKTTSVPPNLENVETASKSPNLQGVKRKSNLPHTDKFARTQILLSLWQLVEENYPLPLTGELAVRYENYVFTKDSYKEVTAFSPMFGLDCEMCKTTTGQLELTRVSVVNENLESVYESLVKPDNKIIDYLTRFSGITPAMMNGVTKRLADVQKDLRELLPADAILVGQSLNMDLHSLKMMHPYIVDTSVIFNISGERSRKSKLQTLAFEFLKEQIQQGGRHGHCSIEDSSASLKLVQLKLSKNIEYGDAVLLGSRKSENNYKHLKNDCLSINMFDEVNPSKNIVIIGQGEAMEKYKNFIKKSVLEDNDNKKSLICETVDSNRNVIKRLSESLKENCFTLAHLKLTDEEVGTDNAPKTFKSVNKWVQKVYNHLASYGLIIVLFVGQGSSSSGVAFVDLKKPCRV